MLTINWCITLWWRVQAIFGDCVGDPNDTSVRLDYYLFEGGWEVEDCWIEGDK